MEGKMGYIYIIGNLFRKGVASFISELEFVHYPPETEANDKFNVFYTTYQNMVHVIAEIPSRDYGLADLIAVKTGLRLVPGKPHDGNEPFSLKCGDGCCFTLEFIDSKSVLVSEPEYLAALNNEITGIIKQRTEECPDTHQ